MTAASKTCTKHPDEIHTEPPKGSCRRCWRLFIDYAIHELDKRRIEIDSLTCYIKHQENKISDLRNELMSANDSRAELADRILVLREKLPHA